MKKVKIIPVFKVFGEKDWELEEKELEEFFNTHNVIEFQQSSFYNKGALYTIVYEDDNELRTKYKQEIEACTNRLRDIYRQECDKLTENNQFTFDNIKKKKIEVTKLFHETDSSLLSDKQINDILHEEFLKQRNKI